MSVTTSQNPTHPTLTPPALRRPQVLPDGLAASHGLPARSGSADGLSLCNWYITEVNSRAVSLFSKGDELGSRLAAVGRDISLVVQPADLVKLLKRQLKAIRGYKQYVVQ